MSAFEIFMRGLHEQEARDTAILAQLDAVPPDRLNRLAADPIFGVRVRTLMARRILYLDDVGTCHVNRLRFAAAQRQRARRRVAAFLGIVTLILLPAMLVVIASGAE